MSEPFTRSVRPSPAPLQRILISAACIHNLELPVPAQNSTIGEGLNVDRPVNQELRLVAQLCLHHSCLVQRLHYDSHYPKPPVYLPLTIFSALVSSRRIQRNWRCCSWDTWTPNQPTFTRFCCADPHPSRYTFPVINREEDNKTTSSAKKNRDVILRLPSWTHSWTLRSCPWKPWQSPTPNKKTLDLIVQTQFSVFYTDRDRPQQWAWYHMFQQHPPPRQNLFRGHIHKPSPDL